jgi:hypothetical protein
MRKNSSRSLLWIVFILISLLIIGGIILLARQVVPAVTKIEKTITIPSVNENTTPKTTE